jgi:hypothetical protein
MRMNDIDVCCSSKDYAADDVVMERCCAIGESAVGLWVDGKRRGVIRRRSSRVQIVSSSRNLLLVPVLVLGGP